MMSCRRRFSDDDLLRQLKEASLLEIGSALSSDLPQNWIALATRLGLDNDEIEQLRRVPNPGYEVLRRYRTRSNTTIRVLRNALTYMKRSDVIDLLNKAMTDPTDVTIVIRCEENLHEVSQGGVPGLTTLLEYVRPYIHRTFWQVLNRGVTFARLNVDLSPGSNRSWTSAVAEFMGQQIEIELFPAPRRPVRAETAFCRKSHYLVERNCQSYMENDLLFFEVAPHALPSPPSPRTSVPAPLSTSPSLSINFDNGGPVQQSPDPQSDDFPSSPVCQCSSPVPQENFAGLPGFHPEIPTDDTRRSRTEEVLRGSLARDGAYILRRTTNENCVLSLSVVCNGRVIHFSIMRSITEGSFNYFIFGSDNFPSVYELIAFYRHHSLSAETMAINTQEVFLTTPVP